MSTEQLKINQLFVCIQEQTTAAFIGTQTYQKSNCGDKEKVNSRFSKIKKYIEISEQKFIAIYLRRTPHLALKHRRFQSSIVFLFLKNNRNIMKVNGKWFFDEELPSPSALPPIKRMLLHFIAKVLLAAPVS